jgi:hypothetical protein
MMPIARAKKPEGDTLCNLKAYVIARLASQKNYQKRNQGLFAMAVSEDRHSEVTTLSAFLSDHEPGWVIPEGK